MSSTLGVTKSWNAFSALSMIAAIAFFSFAPSASFANDDPEAVMKTVGGILRVVDSDEGQHLTLNNKEVLDTRDSRGAVFGDARIRLRQKHQISGNEVVLVQTNCDGTACNFSTLSFLTITPAGKYTVSDGMDADEEGWADVKLVGSTLSVTTKTYEGRRSKTHRWVYSNGKVAKSK